MLVVVNGSLPPYWPWHCGGGGGGGSGGNVKMTNDADRPLIAHKRGLVEEWTVEVGIGRGGILWKLLGRERAPAGPYVELEPQI